MVSWSFKAPQELSDEQYLQWQTLLEQRTGICFLQHKSIMQKGLLQRMREVGIDDYQQYFSLVSAVPEGAVEWQLLVDRVSVKETSFFREPFSFAAVRQYLLSRLDAGLFDQDSTLDIWSVGCSTGEEAYSLAMMASDMLNYTASCAFLGVVATDISRTALAVASQGVYPARKLEALSPEMLQQYFVAGGKGLYQVRESLRQNICFVQGNITELNSVPKMKMDIIFCQNVLLYFRREKQKSVLDILVEHLKPGGMLMLGPGEVAGWRHPEVYRSSDEFVQAYLRAR